MGKQTFCALRCHACSKFCVQLQKKSGKWTCPVCGAKQSALKSFAVGDTARDVRLVVQELNACRGAVAEAAGSRETPLQGGGQDQQQQQQQAAGGSAAPRGTRRWDEFAEASSEGEASNDDSGGAGCLEGNHRRAQAGEDCGGSAPRQAQMAGAASWRAGRRQQQQQQQQPKQQQPKRQRTAWTGSSAGVQVRPVAVLPAQVQPQQQAHPQARPRFTGRPALPAPRPQPQSTPGLPRPWPPPPPQQQKPPAPPPPPQQQHQQVLQLQQHQQVLQQLPPADRLRSPRRAERQQSGQQQARAGGGGPPKPASAWDDFLQNEGDAGGSSDSEAENAVGVGGWGAGGGSAGGGCRPPVTSAAQWGRW